MSYCAFFSLLLYDSSKDAILTWRLVSLFLSLWLWPKHHSISLKTSLLILKRLFWKSERTSTVSSFHFLSNDLLILKAMLMPLTETRKGHDKKEVKAQKLLFWEIIYMCVCVCVCVLNKVYVSKPSLHHSCVHKIKYRPF